MFSFKSYVIWKNLLLYETLLKCIFAQQFDGLLFKFVDVSVFEIQP